MTSTETKTTTHRALCASCGTERTVRIGGPRNYSPRGWNSDLQSAELKCSACGGIRPHAVIRDQSGSAYFQARNDAIAAIANAESLGIDVRYRRFSSVDCCVSQYLDEGDWLIELDERLQPSDQAKAIQMAREYIDHADGTRWWVRTENERRLAQRWINFRIGSTVAWRPNDPVVHL